jgi:hypothetical protein
MKPKALLPLLIVFAALAVLVVLKQSQKEELSLPEQADLQQLIDADLDITALSRVELYPGAKADEKLILTKLSDDEWEITSRYNAPVDETILMEFLTTVKGFVGEFRATAEGALLADYDLSDEIGFHAVGYSADSDSPEFHLISGKSPDFGSNFVRAGGSNDIYLIDTDLRQEAGIYAPDMDAKSGPDKWMDKSVFKFDKETVTSVSITYPDKSISAQKVVTQKTIEPEEGAEDAEPKVEDVVNWDLTGGGLAEEANDSPFLAFANRLSILDGMTVADPEKAEKWGMIQPPYALKATIEGGDDITIEAARPDMNGPGYLKVTSNEKQHIYRLSKISFEQLFPSGTEYFEMPGILLEQDSIDDIQYDTPEGNVHLKKQADGWNILEPASDIPMYAEVTSGLERTISSFQATDYADNRTVAGLDAPKQKISFTGPGVSHRLAVGNDALHTAGKYVQLDTDMRALVLSEKDYSGIFMPPFYLFKKELFDIEKETIEYISVQHGEKSFTLTMDEEGVWSLKSGEDVFEPIETEVDFLLDNITQLEAEEFIHNTTNRQPGNTYGTVKFREESGKEYLLTVEDETENQFAARVSGLKSAYVLGKGSITRLFAEVDGFRPAVEEASPIEEETPSAP